jgi:hypothetical protein
LSRDFQTISVSATQLELFRLCQRKWHRRYIAGVKDAPSESMLQGSYIHAAIENHLGNSRAAINVWREDTTPEESTKANRAKIADNMVKVLVRSGYLPLNPDNDYSWKSNAYAGNVEVESELFQLADGGPEWFRKWVASFDVHSVGFIGKIDLIRVQPETETIFITDWKSCRNFKYAKTSEELRTNVQRILYCVEAALIAQTHGMTDPLIQFQHVQCNYAQMQARNSVTSARVPEILADFQALLPSISSLSRIYRALKFEPKWPSEHTTLEPNFDACGAYGGCPAKILCFPPKINPGNQTMNPNVPSNPFHPPAGFPSVTAALHQQAANAPQAPAPGYGPPQGAPAPGYGPPQGPPAGYGPPQAPPAGYGPPQGPPAGYGPPQAPGYGPPPVSSPAPPVAPPFEYSDDHKRAKEYLESVVARIRAAAGQPENVQAQYLNGIDQAHIALAWRVFQGEIDLDDLIHETWETPRPPVAQTRVAFSPPDSPPANSIPQQAPATTLTTNADELESLGYPTRFVNAIRKNLNITTERELYEFAQRNPASKFVEIKGLGEATISDAMRVANSRGITFVGEPPPTQAAPSAPSQAAPQPAQATQATQAETNTRHYGTLYVGCLPHNGLRPRNFATEFASDFETETAVAGVPWYQQEYGNGAKAVMARILPQLDAMPVRTFAIQGNEPYANLVLHHWQQRGGQIIQATRLGL